MLLSKKGQEFEAESRQDRSLEPARWLEQHGNVLFSIALRQVRDASLAEELLQETLLAAFRTSKDYEGRSSERTWLVAILKHKIIDHIRKETRRRKSSSDLEPDVFLEQRFLDDGHFSPGIKPWQEDPADALEQRHFQEAVNKCIEKLPPRLANAFLLREIDGQSAEEVCKALGISTTNLWVMLHRSRVRLRDCLSLNWFERK